MSDRILATSLILDSIPLPCPRRKTRGSPFVTAGDFLSWRRALSTEDPRRARLEAGTEVQEPQLFRRGVEQLGDVSQGSANAKAIFRFLPQMRNCPSATLIPISSIRPIVEAMAGL